MQLLLCANLNKLRFNLLQFVIISHRKSLSHRVIEIWITKENNIYIYIYIYRKCNEVWL
jgi:hypothetical protein